MDFLARREYLGTELAQRLRQYDFEPLLIEQELAKLVSEGLLSDARFVDSFISARQRRGQGPERIHAELLQRGAAVSLIEDFLDSRSETWMSSLRDVYVKRFGTEITQDFKQRSRQQRFLRYRGFTAEQISRLFKQNDIDE